MDIVVIFYQTITLKLQPLPPQTEFMLRIIIGKKGKQKKTKLF